MKNKLINIILGIMLMTLPAAALSANCEGAARKKPESPAVGTTEEALCLKADSVVVANHVMADSIDVIRDGSRACVRMMLDISGIDPRSSRAVLLTPYLTDGQDSLDLPSVGIYGRQRWYYYLRQGRGMISGKDELKLRAGRGMEEAVQYSASVAYRPWMNGSTLMLRTREYACCGEAVTESRDSLCGSVLYVPEAPPRIPSETPAGNPSQKNPGTAQENSAAEREVVKICSISGQAYVDFRLDRTEVDLTYGNNFRELGRIHSTIDSLRTESGVTVLQIRIKGYASPEGSYRRNAELAEKRTATIGDYIRTLYDFAPGVVFSESEPEDWEGFILWLEGSSLPHAEEILAVARNGEMSPDAKERTIRRKWPEEAKIIIEEAFPKLRRTEYRIEYLVEKRLKEKDMQ